MELSGCYAYLVSPVEADGRVRREVLTRLVDHVIERGVEGLSPLGSTGEIAYLTEDQRRAVVEATLEAARGRVPVVPGVEAFSTHAAVRQAQAYAAMGVDGLVVMLSTYFPVSTEEVAGYFAAVAEAVSCPVVLYFNPAFVGGGLSLHLLERLAPVPNIRYIKEASGNTGLLLSVLNRFGDRFRLFSASAHIPLVVLMMGGVGWMGGPVCLVPRASRRLVDWGRAGRWAEAWPLQRKLWEINRVFQRWGLAACVKAGLSLQGFDVGPPIAPQAALGTEALADIRRVLESLADEEDGAEASV
jgi:4-hydroxy-tetrahydrodipicolinate synthase